MIQNVLIHNRFLKGLIDKPAPYIRDLYWPNSSHFPLGAEEGIYGKD